MKPTTFPRLWRSILDGRRNYPALKIMRDGKEYSWTWEEYYNDSISFAKSLQYLGVDERKSVNIMGFNSPEWVISLFGSIFHNNVVSGLYITNGPDAC